MSLSGGTLLNAAVERLGRLYPGESLSSSEQTDFLAVANSMIDNWSLERINVPVVVVSAVALTSGTAAYTFGAGGSFGSTRFIRIDTVGLLLPSAAIAGTFVRFPIRNVSQQEYQAYPEKTRAVQIPELFYYDYQFPTATGNLAGTPTFTGTAPKLEIGGWQALAEFPDLTTVVNTPQGLDEALITNLAIRLAPLLSVSASGELIEAAKESKAAVRAMNASNFSNPGAPPGTGQLSAADPMGPPPPKPGA
jgi:hypothetical protein